MWIFSCSASNLKFVPSVFALRKSQVYHYIYSTEQSGLIDYFHADCSYFSHGIETQYYTSTLFLKFLNSYTTEPNLVSLLTIAFASHSSLPGFSSLLSAVHTFASITTYVRVFVQKCQQLALQYTSLIRCLILRSSHCHQLLMLWCFFEQETCF